jgi:hypothetical protein
VWLNGDNDDNDDNGEWISAIENWMNLSIIIIRVSVAAKSIQTKPFEWY